MYREIVNCRICGNDNLVLILDLGEQTLTGVFPATKDQEITVGPLRLVKCVGEDCCNLVQLQHSYDLGEMYGENYGYRSGLNASMVAHLYRKVERIRKQVKLVPGDLIIDIGSNDSTTLRAYQSEGLTLVGVDPTGVKFREFYPPHIQLIADFFSADVVQREFPGRKAKVITSFSMFYDLEAPMEFMRQVHRILAEDGIWVFEQSYMPSMLATNSYDTVCHEHLEFYGLHQIKWMADRVGFEIVDVEFNDVNGGSFSITLGKSDGAGPVRQYIQEILDDEVRQGLHTLAPYKAFEQRVLASREALLTFIERAAGEGKVVAALGASTKGNVLLQYCGLSEDQIPFIGEVNEEKFGCFTPGSLIPIIPERELLLQNPEYLIILPWHFSAFFESSPHFKGRKLVLPLPELKVVEL